MALPEVFRKVADKAGWSYSGDTIEIPLEGGRKQTIKLLEFEHEGRSMIRAFTEIGDSKEMSPTRLESALSLNFGLPHGALAVHDGQLVMVDTFLLDDADEDEVESSLYYLAVTGDRYERLIYHTDQH